MFKKDNSVCSVFKIHSRFSGFTIVELLVVIVIVGILAVITIVSYTGIQSRAVVASLVSDLHNASKQLKLDQVINSSFPATLANANEGKGLLASPGTTYLYAYNNNVTPQTFCVTAVNDNYSYTVNNEDILLSGGKNVVRSSDNLSVGGGSTGITSSLTPEGYLQVISTVGNGNWFSYFVIDYTGIEDSFNENDDVVVTMEMKSPNHNSIPKFYFKPNMGYYSFQGNMGTNFSIVWLTTKWKKANSLMFHLGWSSVVGTTIIKNIKIAKGTVPTCWTPAV